MMVFVPRKRDFIAWLQVLLMMLLHMEAIHMKEATRSGSVN